MELYRIDMVNPGKSPPATVAFYERTSGRVFPLLTGNLKYDMVTGLQENELSENAVLGKAPWLKATQLTEAEGIDDIVKVFEQAAKLEAARAEFEEAAAGDLAARTCLMKHRHAHSPRYLFESIGSGLAAFDRALSKGK